MVSLGESMRREGRSATEGWVSPLESSVAHLPRPNSPSLTGYSVFYFELVRFLQVHTSSLLEGSHDNMNLHLRNKRISHPQRAFLA